MSENVVGQVKSTEALLVGVLSITAGYYNRECERKHVEIFISYLIK